MNPEKDTTAKAVQHTSNDAGDKSFRVLYYGSAAAGSIPFKWESQPGTPKQALTESSLPPLTPSPSYQMHKSSMHLSSKRSGFLKNIFRRNIEMRPTSTPMSYLHTWQATPMSKTEVRRMMSVVKGYGEQEGGSPGCIGGGFKRSYRINNKMKKAIQWFVRHGKRS
ncbi:uncharacterized protein LOC143532989 [Bidens hawaiensis]|uniref:uncharacterized protein LOC143532989 n=1 Tax=Bidens hawaiensis TaxID=980011 RepID=UPI00404B34D4